MLHAEMIKTDPSFGVTARGGLVELFNPWKTDANCGDLLASIITSSAK